MTFHRHVRERLDALRAASLHRATVTLESPPGPQATFDGRRVIQLASNDYLGLASHPSLAEAVARGAQRWGTGAGAAPLVTGHTRAHADAERSLASFVGADRALLFPTGYMANVGTVQALVGRGDLVVSDALNHASLIDGARLSGAKVMVYPHRDVDAARRLLAAHRSEHRAALLVTDAIFSMDATAAPLAALREITEQHGAGMMVDEAHALGVIGPSGRGLSAQLGVRPDVVIGTMGKAFGLMGAFAASSAEVVDLIRNRARTFVFATALSPAIAAAIPQATELVTASDDRRAALGRSTELLVDGLRARGYDVRPETGPILPVWLGAVDRATALAARLLERGILVRAIRPPTVPEGTARLRVVASATTTAEHVQAMLDALPPASDV